MSTEAAPTIATMSPASAWSTSVRPSLSKTSKVSTVAGLEEAAFRMARLLPLA